MLCYNNHLQPLAPATFVACRKCFGEIAPRKSHKCTEAQAVRVVAEHAEEVRKNFGKTDSKATERVATRLIKLHMEREGIKRGEMFSAVTGC